jgi:teichuronic acid biosynthesis glycosyltransferase TuaC
MSTVDAPLLTFAHEGSPNGLNETFANELPVVSVPVGDMRERVDGVEGCHVEAPPGAGGGAGPRARAWGRLRDGRASTVTLEWARERLIEVYREAVR